ncbi:MAG: sigma-70 family RNA polymerase sigma factor [Coleofasciculus sp. C2-GNP5-27]
MNQLDTGLKQLAIEAQRHPAKSQQRQLVLAKLLTEILHSGKLCYPYPGQFRGFYEEIYAEAKQQLFEYVCERIEMYNPESQVLAWVNFLLKKRFFSEASRDILPIKGLNGKTLPWMTIDELEKCSFMESNPQLNPSLSQQVIQILQEDPEGIFQGTYTSNNPAANFQYLAIKLVSGYSWNEISQELGIKISTLSSFYQRCLVKFSPKIKDYLS